MVAFSFHDSELITFVLVMFFQIVYGIHLYHEFPK